MLPILAAALLAPSPCHADFFDGNELSQLCTSEGPVDEAVCLGYVEGAADIHGTWQAYESKTVRHEPIKECMPEHTTGGELQKVIIRYLQAHPEQLHENASALIIRAIVQEWCPPRG
ncbi:MAG: Rap1a/Tai family immunity protein [Stellaceae bacterium]